MNKLLIPSRFSLGFKWWFNDHKGHSKKIQTTLDVKHTGFRIIFKGNFLQYAGAISNFKAECRHAVKADKMAIHATT